jgi:hypothetical protein
VHALLRDELLVRQLGGTLGEAQDARADVRVDVLEDRGGLLRAAQQAADGKRGGDDRKVTRVRSGA